MWSVHSSAGYLADELHITSFNGFGFPLRPEDVAAAMRRERYFEAPVAVYSKGLVGCVASIAKALKEPVAYGGGSPPAPDKTPQKEGSGAGVWFFLGLLGVGGILAVRGKR